MRNSQFGSHQEDPLPEGEEQAPRWVSTMSLVRWILLGAVSLFAVVMVLGYFGLLPTQDNSEAVRYHCPMHPTYITDHPGECPICGMTLVPVSNDAADSSSQGGMQPRDTTLPKQAQPGQYTCPMDPDVISDTPGRCPKCGMVLEKVPEPASSVRYTCPMHPEVVTDKPGVCPICGMELVPKADSTHADTASGVAGLVPVTIAPERLQLIGVRTGKVETRPLDGAMRLPGTVTPDESRLTSVTIRFPGWIRELAVSDVGQHVKAGQPIVSVYSQELYQAEQDYLLAKQALAAASDPQVRDARLRLFEASRQRLELLGIPAEERLRLETEGQPGSESWISSPVSGVVLEKNVVSGQSVGPDQSLFVVADLSRVWVLADVYERDLAHIKVGQTVQLTTSAWPGESFQGAVRQIYPAVSAATRTLKVRAEFANADGRLVPGQFAELELAGSGSSVLAIPREAVMDDGDRQYAFVVRGGTHFEPRLVQLGRRTDDFVEVRSGLLEGEVVVTSANFLIDAESRLKAAMTGMSPAHESHVQTDSGSQS